jgi:hypothetical protein
MLLGLDIVIRLEDMSDAPLLRRALFAIFAQELDLPLAIHLMLPRFWPEDLQRLRASLEPLRPLNPSARVLFHNWQSPGPLYLQAPLLNWSVELTSSRYFTVQAVADLLAPNAYAVLLNELRQTNAALVATPLALQAVEWWGDAILPVDSVPHQPSEEPTLFMLDRSRIELRDLVFTTGRKPDAVDFESAIHARYLTARLQPTRALGLRQAPN